MDIFSHGLWSGVIYKFANIKIKEPLKIKWAIIFGLFPDFFAFAPLFIWLFWGIIFGQMSFSDFPRPDAAEPAQPDTFFIFRLTSFLYSFTHSLIAFMVIFILVYFIFKKPVWELGAWLAHILVDIPTHSYKFYPTPFLWPFSDIKFNGFSWGAPWFIVVNYSLIAIVYFYFYLRSRKPSVI